MAKQTAKYGNWNVGDPADDDARMVHYCKRQIGKFLNRFPEPTRMDVAQHVTRFLQANLPPIMVAKMSDVMRAAETAETVERRKFYVLRLLQMMSSGRPHQVVQRLKQPYAPRPAEEKSAKAAAVVEAAKAVGTKRVKADAVPPELRTKVARYIVEIRTSLVRGYINQLTTQGLLNVLGSASHKWRFDSQLQSAWILAGNIADLVSSQPGAQMKDIPSDVAGEIKGNLAHIARLLQKGDVPA